MEDITNYPGNANQTTFAKDSSLERMEEEQQNEPMGDRRPNTLFGEGARDSTIETRNQTILQLLKSYSSFVNETSDVILDMDVVLNRLTETTRNLKPPTK